MGFFGTEQIASAENERIRVAIESSEDVEERDIGFFTYHYPDGRDGIRFRLVRIGEDGKLEVYPSANRFFINQAAVDEYITEHAEMPLYMKQGQVCWKTDQLHQRNRSRSRKYYRKKAKTIRKQFVLVISILQIISWEMELQRKNIKEMSMQFDC